VDLDTAFFFALAPLPDIFGSRNPQKRKEETRQKTEMRRRRRAAIADEKLWEGRHNSEQAPGRDEKSKVKMLGEKRFFVVRRLLALEPY
jgi:hypothetical protein